MGPLILLLVQAAAPVSAAPVAPAAKPKMICVVEDKIGSRLGGKRICYTKEEYARYLATTKAELRARQHTDQFEGAKGSCMRGVDC